MNNDILYNCAKAYKSLMDYEFKLILDNSYTEVTLKFDENDFMHLTSIEKLDDLWEIEHISSKNLLKLILDKKLTFDRLTDSKYFEKLKYPSESSSSIKYSIKDRLLALTHLYSYLHNCDSQNMVVYKWLRDVHQSSRPHQSKINANFLIVFCDTAEKKVDDEKVCSFFVSDRKNGSGSGVSIFPTDLSYSDDGTTTLAQYEILSVNEICKTDELKNCTLIECSIERLKQAQEGAAKEDQRRTIADDLKKLKKMREKHLSKPENAAAKRNYVKRLEIFATSSVYTSEMLATVVKQLNDACEYTNDNTIKMQMKREIEFIQGILDSRQTQSQQLLMEESAPNIMNFQAPPIVGISSGGVAVLAQTPDFASLFSPIINLWERIKSTMKSLFTPPANSITHNADMPSIDVTADQQDIQKQSGAAEEKYAVSRTSSTLSEAHQSEPRSPYYKARATDQEIAVLEQAGITVQRSKKGKESDGKTAIRFDAVHKEKAKQLLNAVQAPKQKR